MDTYQDQIANLKLEIEQKRKQILEIRKQLPLEPIENYSFKTINGIPKKLLDCFGDSNELLVMHNMGKACVYCTMWADGFRGFSEIFSDRMPWILTSPDDVETMKTFSESRHWNFEVLSYHKTNFALDLGFAIDKDSKRFYIPGVSALIKKENKIYRVAKDTFGPGDYYNSAWHFFDLFPDGNKNWTPKYTY